MFLSRGCNDFRENNPDMKTQLRFSDKDIEIMIKNRGSTEPYRTVKYEEIMDIKDIPGYDDNIKWKSKGEIPIRRKITPSPNRSIPPSMKDKTQQPNNTRTSNIPVLTRERSIGSQDIGSNKRTRTNEKLSSTSSEDNMDENEC